MLLPRAASLAPLGVFSTPSGGPRPPGPLLFSVFCFSKRPPARHPEAARPPTDPEIKNARPGCIQLLYSLLTLTVRDPQGGEGKANCTSVLLDTESVL